MSVIARRYARAAISVASERSNDAAVELLNGVQRFTDAYQASAELREVLHNPVLHNARQQALQAIIAKLELTTEAARLVTLLCERNRLALLDEVVQEAQDAVDERLGRARAKVITALALSSEQETRLTQVLEKRLSRPVLLDITVDPTIIGGLVCRVGDLTIDSSVRHKLESLRGRLRE